MGYKSKFKGSTVVERLKDVPKKQDILVSGQNIKTIMGESVLGEGDLDITKVLYQSITYQSLLDLREDSLLVPGKFYRITDYITTTSSVLQGESDKVRSAGHPFDVIVFALTNDTLAERAWACHHDGDTYFQNFHLEAWQIWYCLDNDTSRFGWAIPISEGGRGVIYRMIDENNNDCPYDFKNIQFKSTIQSEIFTDWYYTFSSVNNEFTLLGDASLTAYCFDNTISHAYDWGYKYYLVSNLFLSINIGISSVIRGNHIEENCYNNLIINGSGTHLGTGCNHIYVGSGARCYFGENCSYIYATDTNTGYLCEIGNDCHRFRITHSSSSMNPGLNFIRIVSGSQGSLSVGFPQEDSDADIHTGPPGTTLRMYLGSTSSLVFAKEYLQWGDE